MEFSCGKPVYRSLPCRQAAVFPLIWHRTRVAMLGVCVVGGGPREARMFVQVREAGSQASWETCRRSGLAKMGEEAHFDVVCFPRRRLLGAGQ